MEYKKQELRAWGLSGQFETIENFMISKPTWKQSYGENFFLSSSPSLEATNITRTWILDVLDINWEEVVLSNDWTSTDLNISIGWSILYTWTLWESKRGLSMRGGYERTQTGTITSVWEEDPTKDTNDVFEFWYIKLQLDITPTVWQYITFTSNTTNLQWISTKIHYIQGWFCYVRWTNLYGTLPTSGEAVSIHNAIGDILVIGEDTKAVSVDNQWNTITLFECADDDKIIDIEYFNSTIFILTNNFVFFWRSLINCNINVYPLDFFDNMGWWDRVLSFWKHLILFWRDNQIISPVNGTAWSLWYISNWLNYNHKLFSKYSALSDQWSLYILQDDKEFVKVDIISVANGEYDLQTTDAMPEARWMLSEIEGEVFITKGDKYISIINPSSTPWQTISYNYNIAYQHWVTWKHSHYIKSFWDYIYWETQFITWTDVVDQEISFELWGDTLEHMKTCWFVKMILVAEEDKVPDYTLTIEKHIWWMKYTKDVQLKDYPINNKILRDTWALGYEQFWNTELSTPVKVDDLWYIINVSVRINETADMFIFTLKNNNNKITYWGSVIWYRNWLPEVTAYNYTIKS